MIINIANAEYSIKINLEDEPIKFTNWQEYDSIYGDWTNSNSLYGCSNWFNDYDGNYSWHAYDVCREPV